MSVYVDKLRAEGLLEEFVSSRKMGPRIRERFAESLAISMDEVRHLQMSIFRRFTTYEDDDLFSAPRVNLERELTAKLPERTLYLPTYRRIEKDLKEIMPDLEDRLRSAGRPFSFTRSAKHYVDLVSFGMEDVRSNIDLKSRFLRDYSLSQFNDLSGLYLRDVIKGQPINIRHHR